MAAESVTCLGGQTPVMFFLASIDSGATTCRLRSSHPHNAARQRKWVSSMKQNPTSAFLPCCDARLLPFTALAKANCRRAMFPIGRPGCTGAVRHSVKQAQRPVQTTRPKLGDSTRAWRGDGMTRGDTFIRQTRCARGEQGPKRASMKSDKESGKGE